MGNRLSPKQKTFCREYLTGGSCGAAMRAAGYSDSYADTHGAAILDTPAVRAELERLQVKVEADFDVTLQEVIRNARWLVEYGKGGANGEGTKHGADVAAGNQQLGRSIGAFVDRKEITEELPVRQMSPEEQGELQAAAIRLKLRIAQPNTPVSDRPALVGELDVETG